MEQITRSRSRRFKSKVLQAPGITQPGANQQGPQPNFIPLKLLTNQDALLTQLDTKTSSSETGKGPTRPFHLHLTDKNQNGKPRRRLSSNNNKQHGAPRKCVINTTEQDNWTGAWATAIGPDQTTNPPPTDAKQPRRKWKTGTLKTPDPPPTDDKQPTWTWKTSALQVAQEENPVADPPAVQRARPRFKRGVLKVAQEENPVADQPVVQIVRLRFKKKGVLNKTPVADQPSDKKPRRRFKTGVLQVAQKTPVADQLGDKKPRRRFKTGVLQVAQETPQTPAPGDKKPKRRFRTGVLQVAEDTPQALAPQPVRTRLRSQKRRRHKRLLLSQSGGVCGSQ